MQKYDYMIADTSYLVHLGRKYKENLKSKLKKILKLNVKYRKVIIPPVVKFELIDQPLRQNIYFDSVERFQKLLNEKLIEVREVDYDNPRISKISDEAKRYLAKKSGKYEHLVERADVETITLTFSFLLERTSVLVAVKDKALKEVLKNLLKQHKWTFWGITFLIILSTLFVRLHAIADEISGFAVAYFASWISEKKIKEEKIPDTFLKGRKIFTAILASLLSIYIISLYTP
ncbi:MAG: hypothetical protein ACTSYM_01770 [Candidatus Baldrarchaeia archaeon]